MNIKIVLADDEELFRVGMSHILSRDPEIEIVFQATNGRELIEFLKTTETLPHMVIMDIKMPELNGVEATKEISQSFPEVNIIALTTYNTKPFIRNMIEVGASAYLVKNSPPQKVVHTIKQVYYNGFFYDSEVINALKGFAHPSNKADSKTVFDENFITQREREVLELICLQKTSQEIADALFISKRTVEVHRKNLLEKTEAKNLAGLVIFAMKNSLVPPILFE